MRGTRETRCAPRGSGAAGEGHHDPRRQLQREPHPEAARGRPAPRRHSVASSRRARRDARARRPRDLAAPERRTCGGNGAHRSAAVGRRRSRNGARGCGNRRRHAGIPRPVLRDQRRGGRRAGVAGEGRRRRARQGFARRQDRPGGGSVESGARLMLFHLLYPFHTQLSVLNVTRYITFRTAASTLSALAISLVFGPWLIRKLREFQIGQVIRTEGPQTHRPKAGTLTMGGLLILSAALVPTLLWADLTNAYIWIAVLTTAGYGGIGFADDYLQIVRRSHHGLLPRYKMGFQVLIGIIVGVVLLFLQHEGVYNTRVVFPFFKRLIPDLGV